MKGCDPMFLAAAMKQEDVFKSMRDNVGGSVDPKLFYVLGLAAAAFVLLMVVINSMKNRQSRPRAVNHQGKLMKELIKKVALKGGEVKQLKTMAAEQGCTSPLTLVLCPSLLAKGMNTKGKADKRVVMGVAKKMGILKKK
jgi:hypothetical protein